MIHSMSYSAQTSDTSSTKTKVTTPPTAQSVSVPLSSVQEDFSTIFQVAPTPFLLLKPDSQFTIVNVNEAYLKTTLTKRENLIGKGLSTIFPPTETNRIGEGRLKISLQKVIQSGQIDIMRVQKYDLPKPQEKGGGLEERYWISTQTPVLDKEGKLAIILHQVSDATEFEKRKKLSERAETTSRQQYYADVETIKDCQTCYSRMETEIETCTQKTKAAIEQANEANARCRYKEEEDKRRLQQAEEHRQKSEVFVDTLCHELRNPANGIYGNVSLLETLIPFLEKLVRTTNRQQLADMVKNSLPKQITDLKEVTSSIEKCVKYQKCLLDDILNVSKLESGKIKLEEVESHIKSILQDVISMFSADINQKKLKIFTLLPQEEVRVKVDANRLSQILINLLSNAIKFTPSNGKITLGLSPKVLAQEEVELEFSVEDSGIGMSREEQSRLFNRFEQVGRNTSREYSSSGLGLVICKNLITLMKGKIEIESEPSKGTRCHFTIRCPSVKPSESLEEKGKDNAMEFKATPTSSSPFPSPTQKLNILVVEDNLINQRLLVRLFERAGHTCKVANNGREAVDIATLGDIGRIPFDVILMDIEMPLMNGIDATIEIRAREKKFKNQARTVPILAISGYSSEEYMQRARMAGMNGFITKPYEINTIIPKVKECIVQLNPNHQADSSATEVIALTPIQPLPSSSFFTSSSTSPTTTASSGSEKSRSVSLSLTSVEPRFSASFSFFTPSPSSSSTLTASTAANSEKTKKERGQEIS